MFKNHKLDDDEYNGLIRYGNNPPWEEITEHYFDSEEVQQLNRDSFEVSFTGDVFSGIEGFNGDDIPLWDGDT
jgi:hypothetical protein